MQILITSLFPSSKNFDNVVETKAIFNLIENQKILVIYPVFLPYSIKKIFNHLKEPYYKIKDVRVLKFPILKIPTKEIYILSILKFFIRTLYYIKPIQKIVFHRVNLGLKLEQFLENQDIEYNYVVHASDIELLNKYNINTDKLNFRSHALKKKVEKNLNMELPRASIVYSGIEKSEIISLEESCSKHFNDSSVKLITVCSLIKLKNVDIILRKLALWRNKDWEYTIVGDGLELENLKKLVAELGIENKVNFTGKLNYSKVAEHLLNAHYFIMLSRPETFGLVYLEAMSKGCIVFCSSNNGVDGIVNNNINGFIINESNEFTSILDCLDSNEEHRKMILKNSIFTINRLTKENATRNYIDNILM